MNRHNKISTLSFYFFVLESAECWPSLQLLGKGNYFRRRKRRLTANFKQLALSCYDFHFVLVLSFPDMVTCNATRKYFRQYKQNYFNYLFFGFINFYRNLWLINKVLQVKKVLHLVPLTYYWHICLQCILFLPPKNIRKP